VAECQSNGGIAGGRKAQGLSLCCSSMGRSYRSKRVHSARHGNAKCKSHPPKEMEEQRVDLPIAAHSPEKRITSRGG
jgi:hypothetical protein